MSLKGNKKTSTITARQEQTNKGQGLDLRCQNQTHSEGDQICFNTSATQVKSTRQQHTGEAHEEGREEGRQNDSSASTTTAFVDL